MPKKAFKRSANAQVRDTPYNHNDARDVKNMTGAIKRRFTLIKRKMDDLNELCGITSFFMFASEVQYDNAYYHSYCAPSGNQRRPIIAQQTINTIGQALQNSLRYHQANTNFYDDSHVVSISNEEAISIIKNYMKGEPQNATFEDLDMFANSLRKKTDGSPEDLFALATCFNNANISIKLENPIQHYERKAVIAFIVLMLTVVNFDEVEFYDDSSIDRRLKSKLQLLQKQIQSCFVLQNTVPAFPISCNILNDVEDVQDTSLHRSDDEVNETQNGENHEAEQDLQVELMPEHLLQSDDELDEEFNDTQNEEDEERFALDEMMSEYSEQSDSEADSQSDPLNISATNE